MPKNIEARGIELDDGTFSEQSKGLLAGEVIDGVEILGAEAIRQKLNLGLDQKATVKQSIQEKIISSIENPNPDRPFMPLDIFNNIINVSTVTALLFEEITIHHSSNIDPKEAKAELLQRVRDATKRRRILGILLYMDRLNYLQDFLIANVSDDAFPISRDRKYHRGFIARAGNPKPSTEILANWRRTDIDLLHLYQHIFFVPVFNAEEHQIKSYELGSRTHLPILQEMKQERGVSAPFQKFSFTKVTIDSVPN
jgi:hypothetical protein